ncbi:hypothetical protein DAPPUDRAFT_237874 [Daphnia pulex]|uniref:RHD domain-containing protein n=1 Tax=Daphnia pulex TaxID=6669 RepID=E9G4M5_DAPPU|nr:hypothetical protein DAPPUDRAFT_237874 [Daphnia pulex]|eukprot:EFX85323.1 hypothetical protein DAPPUDRAFT_237874 [Daphnia pulex]
MQRCQFDGGLLENEMESCPLWISLFILAPDITRTARLKITRQPQSTYNFPYESEVKNGRGYLYADPADEKRWIRVQLENWEGEEDEVCIRCSLVTDSPDRSPHFHRLGIRKTNRIQIQECQDGVLSKRDDCITAT